MNKNIKGVVLLSNLLFYIGIFYAVYLFCVDDNTPKWLVVILCLSIGIIGSAIPDAMINIGIESISITHVRIGLFIKYVVFLICLTFLNIATIPTIVCISLLFAADIPVEALLLQEIYKTNITLESLCERLKETDTSPIDGIIKYLVFNILAVFLFANLHEGMVETIVMLIVCICLHVYVVSKFISKMSVESPKSKRKVLLVLWILEIAMLILAYFDKTLAVCVIFGNYYVVVTDLVMQRKTSIFHSKT